MTNERDECIAHDASATSPMHLGECDSCLEAALSAGLSAAANTAFAQRRLGSASFLVWKSHLRQRRKREAQVEALSSSFSVLILTGGVLGSMVLLFHLSTVAFFHPPTSNPSLLVLALGAVLSFVVWTLLVVGQDLCETYRSVWCGSRSTSQY
jgi:hypothetical protein